ncbi:hypothetical protein [Cellulomonas telluris]|uniref:hypothetical protein n=1 Tax=Cellulomonas telluris TaxID=2306636 RepID=UPI0010A8285D|nr:hypothetical protein [Cellulomonas telluris]
MQTASPTLPAGTAPAAPPGAGPVLARPLLPAEAAHLDRLRLWLQDDGVDVHDAGALDARWARLLGTHPADAPAPAGVTAAIGIAVGDLLVHAVPGAVWMMCPGPDGATPGVVAGGRVHMPVLTVLDAHARCRLRTPVWTVDYVRRATAHLTTPAPALPAPAGPSQAPDATPHPGRHAARAATPSGWEPVQLPTAHGAALPSRGRRTAADAGSPAPAAPASAPWEDLVPPTDAPLTTSDRSEASPPAADRPDAVPPEADVVTASTPTVPPASTLTPEDLPHRPSPRVQDLALRALEHALEQALADPRGVAPFVLVQDDDGFRVTSFAHGSEGVADAREHARRCRLAAAAVGWTSPADDVRPYPRVVVDASAAGVPGMRVAHAFAHDADGGREVGGPEVVGQSAPVL